VNDIAAVMGYFGVGDGAAGFRVGGVVAGVVGGEDGGCCAYDGADLGGHYDGRCCWGFLVL